MDDEQHRLGLLGSLMADTSWRERLVEEFVFGAGEHVRVISTFQLGLAPDLLDDWTPIQDHRGFRVFLPITNREKAPLLNFDLRGPESSDCFLLPRDQIGALQGEILTDLMAAAGGDTTDPSFADLLVAICIFTPSLFASVLAGERGSLELALAKYLSDGLSFAVTRREVAEWRRELDVTRTRLVEALGEHPSCLSSSEEVLLAMPHMATRPQGAGDLGKLVSAYRTSSRLSTQPTPPSL